MVQCNQQSEKALVNIRVAYVSVYVSASVTPAYRMMDNNSLLTYALIVSTGDMMRWAYDRGSTVHTFRYDLVYRCYAAYNGGAYYGYEHNSE